MGKDPWLLGLMRGLDRRWPLHRYVVGAQVGGAAGELGALHARRPNGGVPVWRGPDGRLFTASVPLEPVRPGVRRAARWIAEPLSRSRAGGREGARRIAGRRLKLAARRPWRLSVGSGHPGTPLGFLESQARPRNRPLFAAIHPVTGDQLLSTRESEAAVLGYGRPALLGHLVAAAPATGRLAATGPRLPPWTDPSGTPIEPGPSASGRIIEPGGAEPAEADAVKVAGWALLAGEGVATVDMLVNGRGAGRARLGLPRPNAEDPGGSPDRFIAGFEAWISGAALPSRPGTVEIEALVTGSSGTQFVIARDETLELAPIPPVRDSVTGHERARSPRRYRRSPRAPEEGFHLLALTHRLDLGGAQRYLAEQLIRLVRERRVQATLVAPLDGEWRRPLEEAGIDVRVVDGYRTNTLEGYERMLDDLSSWAHAGRFDVALVNTLFAFPGADLAQRLGIPFAWAIHESYDLPVWWSTNHPDGGDRRVRARLERSLAEASALLFATDSTRRLFEQYAPRRTMIKAPYGLDRDAIEHHRRTRDRAATRERLGIPDDTLALLSLGVIHPLKGQARLARAFAEVCDRYPRSHLYLVGQSPYPASWRTLEAFLGGSGMSDRCSMVPGPSEVYSWHAAADIFALASDSESSPIVVREAMAFETPVMASRVFGIPDIITDGRSGWLFEPNDLAELTRALELALGSSPAERRAMGLAAARRVEEAPDVDAYAANLERLLSQLADDPTAAPVWDGAVAWRPVGAAGKWPRRPSPEPASLTFP